MKITFAELKRLVQHELLEADEPKKKQKETQWFEKFFCPRHKVPLKPWYQRIKISDKPEADPMRLAAHKFIQPATKDHPELLPSQGKEASLRRIQWLYCPKMEEKESLDDLVDPETNELIRMPYRFDEKTNTGRKCDYRVSASVKFPGQKADHVADPNSQVAKEEGYGGLEPAPRKRNDIPAVPETLKAMIQKMETGVRWRRVAQGSQEEPQDYDPTRKQKKEPVSYDWKQVKVDPSDRTFTQEDVWYLSGVLPIKLSKDAKSQGKGYAGPKPYFLGGKGESSAALVRILRSMGWEWKDSPTKERSITPPSMPEKPTLKGKWGWWKDDDSDEQDVDDDEASDADFDDELDVEEPDEDEETGLEDRWKW